MKIKELTVKQMETLEGGIDDKVYWTLICTGLGALYGTVNFFLGIGVGIICGIYGPSLDVPPISDNGGGDLRVPDSPSGSGFNFR